MMKKKKERKTQVTSHAEVQASESASLKMQAHVCSQTLLNYSILLLFRSEQKMANCYHFCLIVLSYSGPKISLDT